MCKGTIEIDIYDNVRNQIKVYVLHCDGDKDGFNFNNFEMQGRELEIMQEAENRGTVYSLHDFEDSSNCDELDLSNSFILIR